MTKKILLVEDTHDALESLRELLSMEGFEVITSVDGKDALSKLYLYRPDLIITDLRMPKMDGFQLIERLMGASEYRHIPIIVFSANATPENEHQAIKLGAKRFLKKPSSAELILGTIEGVISA
jgi:CheY-like chemotaxis protein